MNPSDCPLYDKCDYVQKWGNRMCPQDDCGKYGRYISRLQGAREFAEWCIQNNIDFSHCEDSDCDNCNRTICRNTQTYTDVVLAEWQKGAEND